MAVVHFAKEDEVIKLSPWPPSDDEGEEYSSEPPSDSPLPSLQHHEKYSYPSLTQSKSQVTPPSPPDFLHPFLSPDLAEDLGWDLRTAPPHEVDDSGSPWLEPATYPPVNGLMLASGCFKKGTLPIPAARGDEYVTVKTVIKAIHQELHRYVRREVYDALPFEAQRVVATACHTRRNRLPNQDAAAKRVDFFGEDTIFRGLVKVDHTWQLVNTPQTPSTSA